MLKVARRQLKKHLQAVTQQQSNQSARQDRTLSSDPDNSRKGLPLQTEKGLPRPEETRSVDKNPGGPQS